MPKKPKTDKALPRDEDSTFDATSDAEKHVKQFEEAIANLKKMSEAHHIPMIVAWINPARQDVNSEFSARPINIPPMMNMIRETCILQMSKLLPDDLGNLFTALVQVVESRVETEEDYAGVADSLNPTGTEELGYEDPTEELI